VTCQELVELVTEYSEGTLSWRRRRRFERHIRDCPLCARYVEQMRATIRTVGRIGTDSISPRARDELLHAFADWRAAS
jgi:anti-sigma factor RsiW